MAEAVSALPVSWAEHWEDVRLWRILQHLDAGFYVDVGAMDPSTDSVTRAFYERGWLGLDVEPNPYYAERLRSDRPRDRIEQVAAGLERGTATIHVVTLASGAQTGLSTLDGAIAARHALEGSYVTELIVDVVPLAELMEGTDAEDPARFHFLKVDVEGQESSVLAGAELQRFRPLVALIEARAPRQTIDTYSESEEILVRAGYTPAADDGLNRWYVRSEDAELTDVLAPEVNPLLDGVPRRWWEVAREQELIAEVEELGQEAHTLRATLEEMYGSRSWRVTAPLRAVGRALRRR